MITEEIESKQRGKLVSDSERMRLDAVHGGSLGALPKYAW
jgi:hypothetical protein